MKMKYPSRQVLTNALAIILIRYRDLSSIGRILLNRRANRELMYNLSIRYFVDAGGSLVAFV